MGSLEVLHALRVRGMADVATISAITGLDGVAIEGSLTELEARSFIRLRENRRARGWVLLPEGRAEHERLIDGEADRLGVRAELEQGYRRFLELNQHAKEVFTDWQMRPGPDGDRVPNDHTDPGHDKAVLDRVQELHCQAADVTTELGRFVPRFARYEPRLSAAVQRVLDGDIAALARPMSDSYHDIWMELHEDLLVTLGQVRDEADGY